MMLRTRLALAGLAAALLMAFAVGSASAGRISLSNRNFRVVWSSLRFFDNEGAPNEYETVCAVTLEGSFLSATFAKRLDSILGFVTRARVAEASCAGGPTKFLAEFLPWTIFYKGFSGTLPRITHIRVLLGPVAYKSSVNGTSCLYREDGMRSISGEFSIAATGVIAAFEFDPATRLPKAGEPLCLIPTEGGIQNAGEVYVLGTTTFITVRLI